MAMLANIWLPDADHPGHKVLMAIERTRVLHDGLFVRRLLGVDVAPPLAVLDHIGDGRRLAPDEQSALAAAYGEAYRRLTAAIDGDGRAQPDGAGPLLASDVIATDDRGVLYLRGGRENLI